MKRIVRVLLVLLLFFPLFVYADMMKINNTDLSLDLDSSWYIFTRENIENNKQLEELSVSYEYMYGFFYQNEKIMVDALKFKGDTFIELFIHKELVKDVTNLNAYSKEELESFAKEVSAARSCDVTGVISLESNVNDEITNYVKCERYLNGIYFYEYITVVNNDMYLFQFQKESKYDDSDVEDIKKVIENSHYEVKKRVEKEDNMKDKTGGSYDNVVWSAIKGAIIGAAIGAVCAAIVVFFKKIRSKKEKDSKDDNNLNS